MLIASALIFVLFLIVGGQHIHIDNLKSQLQYKTYSNHPSHGYWQFVSPADPCPSEPFNWEKDASYLTDH